MMKDVIERWLGTLFGVIFMGLSLVVTVETVMRKVFTVSLQGADELGGYALAIGATIAFSLALIGRTHIRVDVFHDRFPALVKTALNWLSVTSLAAFAGLMAWLAWFVIRDTQAYQSVAQTPWATSLVYPQTAWLVGLIMFAFVSAGFAIHASILLLSGRTDELNADYGPRSTKQEVDEEVEDLKMRSSGVATNALHSTTVPGARA
jgi:TRAP-type C4-dicarboxylate transport system permease small subunit